ncbi:MAG: hypothetical protein HQ582_00965, partial [Planctomycetes bacterium]|nr:hypothetical protein [Planctomycetota bacterium]
AKALAPGEDLLVKSDLSGGGQMLVRCERLKRTREQDAIVWIIDDDGDFKPGDPLGDKDNDCYVVDYDRDGKVDRLVDYMDNDDDGQADEMEMRYFSGGQLRMAWFGVDVDQDGHMWNASCYEYRGTTYSDDTPGHLDPYDGSGDSEIIVNKYDSQQRRWWPISECPFAWYDTDGDGESEVLIRAAAIPREPYPPAEPDGGNTHCNSSPFVARLRDINVGAIRYCVDVTGGSSPKSRIHYDLSLNMTSNQVPYKFERMNRLNPLRRPPKAMVCIPHKALLELAEAYPANQTGFSWFEYPDDTVAIGCPPRVSQDHHQDGVCWTWDRRYMHDTGGPTQFWNIRREFQLGASKKRELYYSRVDRRIHLRGATEGWIRVGHFGGGQAWGEIRMFDTDGDGYFDRWEIHRAGNGSPVRISTVRDPAVRNLPHDWKELQEVYTQELLPEALSANQTLMEAMRLADKDFHPARDLVRALEEARSDTEKLYIQGIIREGQYLALRKKLTEQGTKALAASEGNSWPLDQTRITSSVRAWELTVATSKLDAAYGEGRYGDAARLLLQLMKLSQ